MSRPRVWSVTPLLNELDLLEVRLRLLAGLVDVHVVSESPVTYRGDAKPLHLAEQRTRFDPWLDQLRYVVTDVVDARPLQRTGDPARWQRENGQRAALREALGDVADDDVVILSDVDELPSRWLVEQYLAQGWQHLAAPRIPMYLYRAGLRIREPQPSLLRLFRGRMLRTASPEELRRASARDVPAGRAPADEADAVPRWGWHMSYFGGVEAVRYKVRQAAHPEEEVAEWLAPEYLAACIRDGHDHRGNRQHTVEEAPWDSLPEPIRADPERFRGLIDPIRYPANYDGDQAQRDDSRPVPERRRRAARRTTTRRTPGSA